MIRGITFKLQEVRPEDDGRLYASMLKDGIIYGCQFSFSGYTLTLSPGYLIASGRLIKVPSVQNYACNGQNEGVARLKLTINLTGIATELFFDQIKTDVDYALEETLLEDLIQEDINDGISTLYQLELARVKLSSGGISSIINHLMPAEYKEASA